MSMWGSCGAVVLAGVLVVQAVAAADDDVWPGRTTIESETKLAPITAAGYETGTPVRDPVYRLDLGDDPASASDAPPAGFRFDVPRPQPWTAMADLGRPVVLPDAVDFKTIRAGEPAGVSGGLAFPVNAGGGRGGLPLLAVAVTAAATLVIGVLVAVVRR